MLLEEKKPEITEEQRQYMTAWMNILIDGRVGMNFFNRKRLEKKLRSYYEALDVWSDTDSEKKREGWSAFAKLWIESCVRDKTYSSAALGMFHLKDETLARKILGEIREVTELIPDKIGLREELRSLRETFLEQYHVLIQL